MRFTLLRRVMCVVAAMKKLCHADLLFIVAAAPAALAAPIAQQVLMMMKLETRWHGLCARCAMASLEEDPIYRLHPAHPQHTINFFQHLSSFKCDACKVVDDNIRDLSYKCTKCRFLIHKSCADAPASFQFQFHNKHPLKLSFSLPELYQMFDQYCRLCSKKLYHIEWLYYCPKCRFFSHFHCARSNRMMSLIEDAIYDSDAVHLPAADETSADQLAEQFVMAMSTKITTNRFSHWDQVDHDLQLMTINELNDKKHDDEILILCNACVKPIRTDHHEYHFYGCVSCNYFMHKACAGLPTEIQYHPPLHVNKYIRRTIMQQECKLSDALVVQLSPTVYPSMVEETTTVYPSMVEETV